MPDNDTAKLKTKILLTVLETDQQALADEIGEHRQMVGAVISGTRKAPRVRRKLADALCKKVTDVILPTEEPAQ